MQLLVVMMLYVISIDYIFHCSGGQLCHCMSQCPCARCCERVYVEGAGLNSEVGKIFFAITLWLHWCAWVKKDLFFSVFIVAVLQLPVCLNYSMKILEATLLYTKSMERHLLESTSWTYRKGNQQGEKRNKNTLWPKECGHQNINPICDC